MIPALSGSMPRRPRLVTTLVAIALLSLAALPVAAQAPAVGDIVAADPADRKVIVRGFDDQFTELRAAIEKAKARSGRDYRVVVVGDVEGGAGAARRLLEQLIDRWRRTRGGPEATGFDPARDVLIVLDVNDRQIVMKVPLALEESSGLDPETLKEQLIDRYFVPRAKDGKYDEALASLVTGAEKWVADFEQARQERARAREVFRTRTMPLALAGLTIERCVELEREVSEGDWHRGKSAVVQVLARRP